MQTTPFTLRLPSPLHNKAAKRAQRERRSLNNWIETILADYLNGKLVRKEEAE